MLLGGWIHYTGKELLTSVKMSNVYISWIQQIHLVDVELQKNLCSQMASWSLLKNSLDLLYELYELYLN